MERTSKSHEFEKLWRQIRREDELIPPRSALTPQVFKDFLPSMVLAEVDPVEHTALIRLAGTAIRDFLGFELTGKDYANMNRDGGTEFLVSRRNGYHEYPYGRCEYVSVKFKKSLMTQCELTLFPLWGSAKERIIALLMIPVEKHSGYSTLDERALTHKFEGEHFIDIGAGVPENM